MVDHLVESDGRLLALWSGSTGGTKNCLDYAQGKGVEVRNLWGSWVKYGRVAA
jgi:hypothetical protein